MFHSMEAPSMPSVPGREIDEIAERAQRDAEFRAAVEADLEAALTQAGYDVDPSLLPELRDRLTAS